MLLVDAIMVINSHIHDVESQEPMLIRQHATLSHPFTSRWRPTDYYPVVT